MLTTRHAAAGLLAVLLLAGCGKPPEVTMQRINPEAPAAAGLPAAPLGEAPSPLLERPPFGLYSEYPSRDTLTQLAAGPISPDGIFRAALTPQGLWVARKDGAWLWQVPLLPPPPPPPPPSGQIPLIPGQPLPPPAPVSPPATKYVAPLTWTARGTLLMRDDSRTWVEIHPAFTQVTALPQSLQGKEAITFSPDAKQVLYQVAIPTGRQLWLAKADGTEPKYQGDNVVGYWTSEGKLVIQKATVLAPGTIPARDLAPDLRPGSVRE